MIELSFVHRLQMSRLVFDVRTGSSVVNEHSNDCNQEMITSDAFVDCILVVKSNSDLYVRLHCNFRQEDMKQHQFDQKLEYLVMSLLADHQHYVHSCYQHLQNYYHLRENLQFRYCNFDSDFQGNHFLDLRTVTC